MKITSFLFEKRTRINLFSPELGNAPKALTVSGDASWQPGYENGMAATWVNIAAGYKPLPLKITTQDKTKWCWAAVTLAIMQYYNFKKGRPPLAIKQADIVVERLGSIVNDPLEMEEALASHYGLLLLAPTDLSRLKKEIISEERPVCIAIDWYGGNADEAHFVVIFGLDVNAPGSPLLYIMDPRYENVVKMSYNELAKDYLRDGLWSETHSTKG